MRDITVTLAIATCQPELFYDCVAQAAERVEGQLDLMVFGNGCTIDPSRVPAPIRVVANESVPTNRGAPFAMHRLWEMAGAAYPALDPGSHVIAYMHDDLFVREVGFNTRIANAFARDDMVALAGVLGALQLGRDEIYRDPYEFWHISRCSETFSNMGNAEVHGTRLTEDREVVFVDGVGMFIRKSVLDKINGWSWWPEEFVHHSYDYALSCQVRRQCGRVMLTPFKCMHGIGMDEATHGGGNAGTSGTPVYQELAEKFGGDTAVHRAGHRWVYDTFRDVLPLRM